MRHLYFIFWFHNAVFLMNEIFLLRVEFPQHTIFLAMRTSSFHSRFVARYCCLFFFLAALSSTGMAQSTFPLWTPNGTVKALAATGNTLYVGGSFGTFVPRNHPLLGSSGVVFTASSTMANHQFPVTQPNEIDRGKRVSIAVPDGQGGWYIAGSFGGIGEKKRDKIVRWNTMVQLSSSGIISDWQIPVSLGHVEIQSIAVTTNTVVMGGYFRSDSSGVMNLIAVDTQTGQNILWSYPIREGSILCMVIKNDVLYVGGTFKEIAQHQRKGVAAFDIRTGALLQWNPFDESYSLRDFSCTSFALGDTTLYACGTATFLSSSLGASSSKPFLLEFSLRNGIPTSWQPALGNREAKHLAMTKYGLVVSRGSSITLFDRSNGTIRDSLIMTEGSILTMTVQDSLLYLGGSFGGVNGKSRLNLAAVNLATGRLTDWAPYANNQVLCMSAVNEHVYVGGDFRVCGLPFIRRGGLAAIDTRTGDILPWNPTEGDNSSISVDAFHLTPTHLYVGGKFSVMSGRSRRSLAAFDVASGKIVEDFTSPFTANTPQIFSMALDGKRLFVGGAGFVYQLDAATGLPIYIRDTSSFGQVRQYLWEISTQYVHTLAIHNRTLYIGGGFLSLWTPKYPSGFTEYRRCLAAIDIDNLTILDWNPTLGSVGSSLDTDYGIYYNTFVGKISIIRNLAYIAGGFSIPYYLGNFASSTRGFAAIDITTARFSSWSPIDSAQTAINRTIGTGAASLGGYPFVLDNGLIYSGGSRPYAIDTAVGARLVWSADTTQDIGNLNAILVHNNVVYVGGSGGNGSGLAAFKAYTRPLTTSVSRTQESLPNAPLLSVHPNPSNGVAIASYLLPVPCRVQMELFDILGRSVRVCVQEVQTAGEHTTLIQTSDLSAGVYFLVLESVYGKSMQRLVVGR